MEVSGKIQAELEVCGPCRIDGASTKADGFCKECEEYMCNRCFSDHLKYKGSKNHVLGSPRQGQAQGKEKDQGTQPCQKHLNYNLRYYCRKHDKVACGDCIVAEHAGCTMEIINDIAANFDRSSEFTSVAEKIKGLESEYTENKRKQETNRKENASMTEKALAEIRRFRKELNEYLDNAEREVITESKRPSKETDDMISDLETKMNQVKLQLDELSATLDTSLYKGDILFIRFVECKRRVSDVEQSLAEIKKKNYIKMFTFKPDERLVDLMASKVKLGTLNILTSKSDETSSARAETKPKSTGIATGGPILSKTETKDKLASLTSTFKDPDPRARGFDVGKRVRDIDLYSRYLYDKRRLPGRSLSGTGTVTSVDPAGYVDVKWDIDGSTGRCTAGAGGKYQVVLL